MNIGRVTSNTGILPVSSNGHPAWSRMSRLGSLHDLFRLDSLSYFGCGGALTADEIRFIARTRWSPTP